MDKEKQIILLADILCEKCSRTDLVGTNSKCCPNAKCHTWNIAEKVISEGYGNVEQAVKEFAESKAKPLIDEIIELMFDDSRSVCQIEGCFKSDDIQCGSSICVEENKKLWKSKVDNILSELYGERED